MHPGEKSYKLQYWFTSHLCCFQTNSPSQSVIQAQDWRRSHFVFQQHQPSSLTSGANSKFSKYLMKKISNLSSILVRVFREAEQIRDLYLGSGEPGKAEVQLSLSPTVWEPAVPMSKGRRRWTYPFKQTEQIHLSFVCSLQALNRLDVAKTHWWRWSSLPSLLIQSNLITDPLQTNVLAAIWASLSQTSWPMKLTITSP